MGKESMHSSNNNHRIHEVVHNNKEEHQSTVVESTSKVNNVKLKIVFDPGVTYSFISPYALDKCGLEACKHDHLESVEMDSRFKKVVGLT